MKTLILNTLALGFSYSAHAQLVSYWSFDTDFLDATGSHHGTARNGAVLTTGGLGFGGGEALSLDGGSDGTAPHVTTADPEGFNFNVDFTWHAYVKSASAAGGIFGRAPATPDIPTKGRSHFSSETGMPSGILAGWVPHLRMSLSMTTNGIRSS